MTNFYQKGNSTTYCLTDKRLIQYFKGRKASLSIFIYDDLTKGSKKLPSCSWGSVYKSISLKGVCDFPTNCSEPTVNYFNQSSRSFIVRFIGN